LHADIYHLFENVHAPPHYINMFMPATPKEQDIPFDQPMLDGLGSGEIEGGASGSSLCGSGSLVGQTAFVVGTHVMAECARLTVDQHDHSPSTADGVMARELADAMEASRSERIAKIVRPHLSAGDVLLFDCRVLHFGLANRAKLSEEADIESTWRPMLYANVTQRWFEDKKNWDRTHLFSELERQAIDQALDAHLESGERAPVL
jgi:hypothetical protein